MSGPWIGKSGEAFLRKWDMRDEHNLAKRIRRGEDGASGETSGEY